MKLKPPVGEVAPLALASQNHERKQPIRRPYSL